MDLLTIILWVLGVVGTLFVLGRIFPTTILGRFAGVARAKADELARAAEEKAAIQLYQKVVDDATAEVKKDSLTVAQVKAATDGLIRRLDSLVNERGTIENDLGKRGDELEALVAAGQGSSERALNLQAWCNSKAQILSQKKQDEETLRGQIEASKASLNRAIERLRDKQRKVKEAKDKTASMKIKLDVAKFDASMTTALSSMGGDSAFANIDEAQERVNKVIDGYAAQASVVQAVDSESDFDLQLQREAKDAQGQDAFKQFMASRKSATSPSDAPKS